MANELAVYDAKMLDALSASLIDGSDVNLPVMDDPEAVTRGILQRTLGAENFEDAFGPQSIPGWGDTENLGKPFIVVSIRFNKSTKKSSDEAPAFYAVVELMDPADGVMRTVQTGGRNVLAQLLLLLKHPEWADRPFKMLSKPTTEGRSVLWLEAA